MNQPAPAATAANANAAATAANAVNANASVNEANASEANAAARPAPADEVAKQQGAEFDPKSADADPRSSELALQLTGTMARLHQRGWCDGTGGNFSCVYQRHPLRLLMAPSGVDKGEVLPQELIVVDGEGLVVQGKGKASAETLLHLEIVTRTGAGAVLHTHSQAATLLSQWAQGQVGETGTQASVALHNLEMLKGLAGISSHETPVAIPVLANDQDLSRLSTKAGPLLPHAPWGLLIAGHGLYAWGADLSEARRHLEILEFLLEQRWRMWLLEALSPSQVPSFPKDAQG